MSLEGLTTDISQFMFFYLFYIFAKKFSDYDNFKF